MSSLRGVPGTGLVLLGKLKIERRITSSSIDDTQVVRGGEAVVSREFPLVRDEVIVIGEHVIVVAFMVILVVAMVGDEVVVGVRKSKVVAMVLFELVNKVVTFSTSLTVETSFWP